MPKASGVRRAGSVRRARGGVPGARSEPRTGSPGARGPARDSGYVTAEAAVALPVLALFALMLIWGLMAASAQLQCVDAARAGARAAARSEPKADAMAAARSAAPDGARVELWREGDMVRVRVRAHAIGPGPLAVNLRGEAAALAEDTVGADDAMGGAGAGGMGGVDGAAAREAVP
ncbi:TadE family type IV pilus minor pilin [Streptomyces rugosispiralis]|uniref:Pilus assembly protein n=1 Tax=Streptomyces rugosispiralis TaxID=2967341 RepID=A0ABT1V0I3_9ACTN|nr:TadE family type IV pilus minor pilin [Streptomyces rugosispiralis]MCQ8190893.1 pilus assembly protein [Streptomyces rugosispiralis]